MLQLLDNKNNNTPLNCYLFPLIFNSLDIEISKDASILNQYAYWMLIVGLIALICFINVIGYLIIYIITIQSSYSKYLKIYPKLVKYFSRITLTYAIIEGVICLFALIIIIISALAYINISS